MRISDWSSDVCSSDLHVRAYGRNRDVVHINDHAWRAATDRQVTNAAKSDRDIVLATFRSEGEDRCDGCQIGSRRNIAALQRFAGACGYGNRHILKPFLTTAGRYDDFAAVDGHFLFGRGWRRRYVLSHHWHRCQQGNACEKS